MNKNKYNEYHRKYYEAHKDELREKRRIAYRKRYEANREAILAGQKEARQKKNMSAAMTLIANVHETHASKCTACPLYEECVFKAKEIEA